MDADSFACLSFQLWKQSQRVIGCCYVESGSIQQIKAVAMNEDLVWCIFMVSGVWSETRNIHLCVRVSRRFAVQPLHLLGWSLTRRWVRDEELLRSRRDTEPRDMDEGAGDPPCRCAWREKERRAAAGRRGIKPRRLTVPTGHGVSHLRLLFSSPLGLDPLCFKSGIFWPDERCGLMAGACFHSSQTPSGLLESACGLFAVSPDPKATRGLLFCLPSLFSCCKRPLSALLAKVANFLWHATTACHKSSRFVTGYQIYQPGTLTSRVRFVTCSQVGGGLGAAQPCKGCPVSGPQVDFTAVGAETRRCKSPGSH